MKKEKMSLVLNMLLIIFECVGFILGITLKNRIAIEYYTEDSNLLALVAALLFVIYMRKGKVPRWVELFKYVTTVCLTLTFLVVLFILVPMYNFNFLLLLFQGQLYYHHLLCPILCLVSFIVYDNIGKLTKKDIFVGMSFTLIYGVVLVPLNIFNVVEGPYPFLMVYHQPVYMSVIWFIVLIGLSTLIAYTVRRLYQKYNYRGD